MGTGQEDYLPGLLSHLAENEDGDGIFLCSPAPSLHTCPSSGPFMLGRGRRGAPSRLVELWQPQHLLQMGDGGRPLFSGANSCWDSVTPFPHGRQHRSAKTICRIPMDTFCPRHSRALDKMEERLFFKNIHFMKQKVWCHSTRSVDL